jgi:ribonuclease HI
MTTTIRFDGGARPNPGPAAIGYVVGANSNQPTEGNRFIGDATNNEAEYKALIEALKAAMSEGCTDVNVEGDSQLIISQVKGDWQVNESHLRRLRDQVQALASEFDSFGIKHIPRKANSEADGLVDDAFQDQI